MSHRLSQINELIRSELNQLLLTELEFPPGCLVTIVRVETSRDLRHAKVWLSVMPTYYIKKVLIKLKSRIGHLQFLLNKKLATKPLPRLNFAIDDTESKAQEIEQLLDQIRKTS
ncbi:MAG: 30S ribosome-binding factor RbfA [Patescibacteria group bacterium]|jgi:ribosome-binding factor A